MGNEKYMAVHSIMLLIILGSEAFTAYAYFAIEHTAEEASPEEK
jgi:hypothetical protein